MNEGVFQHASTFEAGEIDGHVRLDRFETHYEQLFAEVIEDGVITAEERVRLDKAADALGLDRARLRQVEEALQASYEARNRAPVREVIAADDAPPPSRLDVMPDARAEALERRIAVLAARIEDLERELEEARAHVAVEVDLDLDAGEIAAPAALAVPASPADDDVGDLRRRLRHDPRDAGLLRRLHRAAGRTGDADGQLSRRSRRPAASRGPRPCSAWARRRSTPTRITTASSR